MLSQLASTAETLSKAQIIMFRMGTDAHLYDDPDDIDIAPLLDSKFDADKCEALKRLLAHIAQGFDVSIFFPQVVKSVASQSLEVKKLAYLYLLHYAEKRPNEALLSVNSFQKDLEDPNPMVRAWALRTLAGIPLHVITPIVLSAASKCARDPSVYVRKCAANALPSLNRVLLDEHSSKIEEIVGILLGDHSAGVVGVASASLAFVCSNNYSLVRKNYRRLCEILLDLEEWGQIILIGILLRYVILSHGFVKESIMFSLHGQEIYSSKNGSSDTDTLGKSAYDLASFISRCYVESPNEYLSLTNFIEGFYLECDDIKFTTVSNTEVKTLLQCTSPLFWSNNSAVILAAAGVHWIMAPREAVKSIIKPLMFLLRSSDASKYVVLRNIEVFAKALPPLFAACHVDFFIISSDPFPIKSLKLDILCSILTRSSFTTVLKEFQDYLTHPDEEFTIAVVASIGICAQRYPKMDDTCLEVLLNLVKEHLTSYIGSADGVSGVLNQVMSSIKSIIRQNPLKHEKVVVQLVRCLDSIKVPEARTIIIWLVGEYVNLGVILQKMLPTTLEYLAWSFSSEATETRLQILNTVCKVIIFANMGNTCMLKKLGSYVLELAECDSNYDVRDRSRFFKKFLPYDLSCLPQDEGMSCNFVKCMFQRELKFPLQESIAHRTYLPGSLSQIVFHAAPGYEPLPIPNFSTVTASCDTFSESSDEHSASAHCSEDQSTPTSKDHSDPLIQLSDASLFVNITELLSGFSRLNTFEQNEVESNPKVHKLLDSANGYGLMVEYSFSSEISGISNQHVCVVAYFQNCSMEPLFQIMFMNEDCDKERNLADGYLTPQKNKLLSIVMEEITSLKPGKTTKRILHVHFHHHLLPLKVTLSCNGRKFPVKLWPDIGYFVKPLAMNIETFKDNESQLHGIYEYIRSCPFNDHLRQLSMDNYELASQEKWLVICETLVLKMHHNANFFLVSAEMPTLEKLDDDASSLCLRFSSQILRNSILCLITIRAEGKCIYSKPFEVLVKVNCKEPVFGLNLLNRILDFLGEPC